eukprot:scaffold44_cov411-Prasinococcus_capsulatus_cf.AAC.57
MADRKGKGKVEEAETVASASDALDQATASEQELTDVEEFAKSPQMRSGILRDTSFRDGAGSTRYKATFRRLLVGGTA